MVRVMRYLPYAERRGCLRRERPKHVEGGLIARVVGYAVGVEGESILGEIDGGGLVELCGVSRLRGMER